MGRFRQAVQVFGVFVMATIFSCMSLLFIWLKIDPHPQPVATSSSSAAIIWAIRVAGLCIGAGVAWAFAIAQSRKYASPPAKQGWVDPESARLAAFRQAQDSRLTRTVEEAFKPAFAKARVSPIVFLHAPYGNTTEGLSYYGGTPTGPATLDWPRHRFAEGDVPLTFVMQWDCRELADQDQTGLLPKDGFLYFFADLQWRDHKAFRFVHEPGAPENWQPHAPPSDLQPLFGDESLWVMHYCSRHLPAEQQGLPTTLPKWSFTPRVLNYPTVASKADDEWYWDEVGEAERALEQALLALQKDFSGAPERPCSAEPVRISGRPFPSFPHDWAAVRVVTREVMETLADPADYKLPASLKAMGKDLRSATITQWLAEARSEFEAALPRKLSERVPQVESDRLWEWITKVQGCFRLEEAVERAAHFSLSQRSDGLESIPKYLIERESRKHARALMYERDESAIEVAKRIGSQQNPADAYTLWDQEKASGTLQRVQYIHARNPHRMFGPPSYVQGSAEEFLNDHILLLEIREHDALEMHLANGVLQYFILPADLAVGRFDRVVCVASA